MQRLLRELVEHRRVATFHDLHHIVRLDEGHLDVQLGQLVDPIRARVLVSEAPRDLHVLVDAPDHQDLLQLLRRLRQRPDLSREVPRRHDEVARTCRIGADHHRRLDLPEAALDEEVPHEVGHLVSQPHELSRSFPPQVDVAVLPAEGLLDLGVLVHIEGRRLRLIEDRDRVRDDLDLSGRELRVLRALGPRSHGPAHLEHPLAARIAEGRMRGSIVLRVRHDLRDPVAVAEVDEDDLAELAPAVHPAAERHLVPRVGRAELATGVSPQHVSPGRPARMEPLPPRRPRARRHSAKPRTASAPDAASRGVRPRCAPRRAA